MTTGRAGNATRPMLPDLQQAATAMNAADMATLEERSTTLWMNNLAKCSWAWPDPRHAPTCTIEPPSTGAVFNYPDAPDAFDSVQLPITINRSEASRMLVYVWFATAQAVQAPLVSYLSMFNQDDTTEAFHAAQMPVVLGSAVSAPPGFWSHSTQPWKILMQRYVIRYDGSLTSNHAFMTMTCALNEDMTGTADPTETIGFKRIVKLFAIRCKEDTFVNPL